MALASASSYVQTGEMLFLYRWGCTSPSLMEDGLMRSHILAWRTTEGNPIHPLKKS